MLRLVKGLLCNEKLLNRPQILQTKYLLNRPQKTRQCLSMFFVPNILVWLQPVKQHEYSKSQCNPCVPIASMHENSSYYEQKSYAEGMQRSRAYHSSQARSRWGFAHIPICRSASRHVPRTRECAAMASGEIRLVGRLSITAARLPHRPICVKTLIWG